MPLKSRWVRLQFGICRQSESFAMKAEVLVSVVEFGANSIANDYAEIFVER
jgi:hypothetical protein